MPTTSVAATPPPDGRAGITADLVRRLLEDQCPDLARLPVVPVPVDGHDNRTYRLGEELSVRLPTADGYDAGVTKEHAWLPVLAPHLPLPVPEPVALGQPSEAFPRHWSVRRWLPGETLGNGPVDRTLLAEDLAGFLVALRGVPAADGPPAGEHSFHRGGSPSAYDEEARACLAGLDPRLPGVWREALASSWEHEPVWFHGDVAAGNLLVVDGRLAAVIDLGTCGTGDPACDLVPAWTELEDADREVFRRRVGVDDATWARGRGWALWKAALVLRERGGRDAAQERVLARVLRDAVAAS